MKYYNFLMVLIIRTLLINSKTYNFNKKYKSPLFWRHFSIRFDIFGTNLDNSDVDIAAQVV